jgi:Zn-finger protein
MHPFAKRHFDKVLEQGELLGIDKSCQYYSFCRHNDLEDCPFYPCVDESTGGKWIRGAIWPCEDCNWIHRTKVASKVLEEMKNLGINKPEDIEKERIGLNKVKEEVKALPPT